MNIHDTSHLIGHAILFSYETMSRTVFRISAKTEKVSNNI